ncbi:MAG: GAF domain-containing protein, partial [Myxococcales bacterium]
EVTAELLAATAQDARHGQALAQLSPRAYALLPLVARNRCLGLLSLVRVSPGRPYAEEELRRARELATSAALVADNALLLAEARASRLEADRAAERTAQLQAVTAALSGAPTLEEIAELVVRRGITTLGGHAGSIALVSPDRQTVRVVAGVGYDRATLDTWKDIPLETPFPMTDVVRENAPLFLESAEARMARYPHLAELIRRNGAGAMAAAPLESRGEIIGALGLNFPSTHAFGPSDREFVLTLARICAQAIERAQLYEKAVRARERLEMLADVGAFLSSTIDLETLVHGLPARLPRLLADVAWLELDGDGRRFRSGRYTADAARLPLDPGGGYRGAFPPEPLLIPDVRARLQGLPADDAQLAKALGVRSMCVVPLLAPASGSVRGVLSLGLLEGRAHTRADLDLAIDVARRAAAALENARLYREAREADRRKDEFLAMLGHELRNPLAPLLTAI